MSNIFIAANNANSTLGSAMSAVQTTMTVSTGSGILFPNPTSGQQFAVTLYPAGSTTQTPREIMYVTAVSGDTFTVIRGQEGTAATTWNVGDVVQNLWTAGQEAVLVQTTQLQQQAGNWAADTGTLNAGAIALTPAPNSMNSLIGAPIRVFKINTANTGPYTLNVNGLGVTNVYYQGQALVANMLPASQFFNVVLDSNGVFELTSTPGAYAPISANTILSNLLGETASPMANSIAAVLNALGFTTVNTHGSSVSSGYVELPGGTIIQYGGVQVPPATGTYVVTFPIPFPNHLMATVGAVQQGTSNTATFQVIAGTPPEISFTAVTMELGSPTALAFYWIAIGY